MLNKIYVSDITYGEAYENANYLVSTPVCQIDFKINQVNEALARLITDHGVDGASLITAFNPLGQLVSIDENAKANRLLEDAIVATGLPYFLGHGSEPKGEWKEDSYLVIGISLEEAKEMGNLYQQNAIVWINKDGLPELVWLR
jgi:hypothetical protein